MLFNFVNTINGKLVYLIRWVSSTRKMFQLVEKCSFVTKPSSISKRFIIPVIPWVGTDLPWFSIISGLFLARKGAVVVFVLNDLPFGDKKLRFKFNLLCIKLVLKSVAKRHKIVYLGEYLKKEERLSDQQITIVSKLAVLNAVWTLKGETKVQGRKHYIDCVTQQLLCSYNAIYTTIVNNGADVILIPGGIYSTSGIWSECASSLGMRVASYDGGGSGVLVLSVNGLACHLQDIPKVFTMLKNRSEFKHEKKLITEIALKEIEERKKGIDKFSSQVISETREEPPFDNAVMIALNSAWDSSALGLYSVFENNTQWIVETTRMLIDSTDSQIIIRQHPSERFAFVRGSDDYKKILTDNFGNNHRIHFIAADAFVNTYDLLKKVNVVITHTSTLGVEAAMLGRVVITVSSNYYANLGFVWSADERDSYFQHIFKALRGNYSVTEEMKTDAIYCYYLTECCNRIFTLFSPESFKDWSGYDLEKLYSLEAVQMIISSIYDNIPIAFLNHIAKMAKLKGHKHFDSET